MLTYNAELKSDNQTNMDLIINLLNEYTVVVNKASNLQYTKQLNSITTLHKEFYYKTREEHPNLPSQIVIKAEQESLSTYKSIKSNKHKIKKEFKKHNLSLRLDKRIYSKTKEQDKIKITTEEGRKEFKIILYPKLQELMDKYPYLDPLIFVRDNRLFISLTFNTIPDKIYNKGLCLGVDLGIRRVAACSDGRLIIDKKFNKEKRELRYLKRKLQSKNTKTARKHLKRLKRKERNKNKNQTHLVANEILKTRSTVIALENLKGIKTKKYKNQNKNAISQIPLFELRTILTYKAKNMGKHICLVSPHYTSQIDSVTGLKDGNRKGCRYYAKNGLVYDADINAAVNIAKRSKHPVSQGNLLDGQGVINHPIVCKSFKSEKV
jgi:IS605 OrfB family transposase